jgi:serine/threonine protein phosphatase 1
MTFRREIIAQPRMFTSDVVYLRGSQEEMWEKLLQLQFAVNPREVFEWMVAQGVGATIAAYGGNVDQGRMAMREGPMAIGRWTGTLRQAMTDRPGHRALVSSLRRAAHTDDRQLLFVHAGLDPSRTLGEQSDALWWGHPGWAQMNTAYEGFRRVARGFDRSAARARAPGGVESGAFTYTVDGGCGFGGPLVAACLTPDGGLVDRIEA